MRNLDKLDDNAATAILAELDKGSDFDLLLGHIIGVDSAGHSFHSGHPEIERKLRDSEQIIKKIVEKMDDKTTLVVFGDHGMTTDGNHGGSSLLEMRTVVFSYQKTPFLMYEKYRKMKRAFEDMDKTIKQLDLTAILSVLLDVPFPFSNLGIFHPLWAQTSNMKNVLDKAMMNLEQIQTYLVSICEQSNQPWCAHEIETFSEEMVKFKEFNPEGKSDKDILDVIDLMHELANEKHQHFAKIWTEFNEVAFAFGIMVALFLIIFHQSVAFGRSEHQQNTAGVTGMLVSIGVYVGAGVFGLYPVEVSAVVAMIIAYGQSRKQRSDFILWAFEKADRSNWKPKPMLYPCMVATLIVMFILAQEIDSMIQEIDYVTDAFVLLCLGFLWVTQPAHLRMRDRDSYVVIILCIKAAYFLDR